MDDKNNIENLLERFFEGTTTNQEEKQLYDFFTKEEIPDELKKYKPVFEYFHSGIIKETADEKKGQNIIRKKYALHYKKIIYAIGGIAASILILFSVYSLLNHREKSFNPYEGSYIVRNGIRITDIDAIQPELEKTYKEAVKQTEEINRTIEEIMMYGTIDDPKQLINDQYKYILEDVADEYTRKKIEKIFESI